MQAMEKQNTRFTEAKEPRLLLATIPDHLSLTGSEAFTYAIPVKERRGGFMVAVPVDVFTDECLIAGKLADDDFEFPFEDFCFAC